MNIVAGDSRQARTAWTKFAARSPSTMRWSKQDERFMICRIDDRAAAHDGALDHLVHADDRDLRVVDHRRRDDAAQRSEAGERDGGAEKLIARRLAAARGLGEARHFRSARPRVARFGIAHHRHDEPAGRLCRDADVHRGEAREDAAFVVVARVDLGNSGSACAMARMMNGSSVRWPRSERQRLLSCARSSSSAVTSTSSTYAKCGMRRFDSCISRRSCGAAR
jgi:hypothetical protein